MTSKGMAGVDWEERVNFARLREARLAKAQEELERHDDLGALVLFRDPNIRYVTSAWSGTWMVDKVPWRFCFLARGQRPILYGMIHDWQVQEEKNSAPWLGEIRLAITWLRGGVGSEAIKASAKEWASELKRILQESGVAGLKVGFDMLDAPMVDALNEANIKFTDGQDPIERARMVKTEDELELLRQCAAMGTAGFWKFREALRPGIRERELNGIVAQTLFSLGSEGLVDLECVSGPNTRPNLVKTSDRVIDYGDMVNLDILHQHMGYQVPCHRAFVCGGRPTQKQKDLLKQAREKVYSMINAIKAGVSSSDAVKGMRSREGMDLLDLPQFIHGVGMSHWERPYISSTKGVPGIPHLEEEIELKENMCLGPETLVSDPEGTESVNLQEIGFVTKTGFEVITKFPSDELTG